MWRVFVIFILISFVGQLLIFSYIRFLGYKAFMSEHFPEITISYKDHYFKMINRPKLLLNMKFLITSIPIYVSPKMYIEGNARNHLIKRNKLVLFFWLNVLILAALIYGYYLSI